MPGKPGVPGSPGFPLMPSKPIVPGMSDCPTWPHVPGLSRSPLGPIKPNFPGKPNEIKGQMITAWINGRDSSPKQLLAQKLVPVASQLPVSSQLQACCYPQWLIRGFVRDLPIGYVYFWNY